MRSTIGIPFPVKCRGSKHTDRDKQLCDAYASAEIDGITWVFVRWEGEDDPDCYKAACLDILISNWESW